MFGRSVAFTLLGFVLGFGLTANALDHVGHWVEESTDIGADRKGPLNGVAAPMVTPATDYAIHGTPGGFHSLNEAQNMRAMYRGDGFDLAVTKEASVYNTSFSLIGIGRGGVELLPGKSMVEMASDGRLEVDHGTFRMIYTNDRSGMRHDLVVMQEPEGKGPLEARLLLAGDLLALQTTPGEVIFNSFDARSMELSPVLRYNGLLAWDARGHVLPSSMELRGDQLVLSVAAENALYPVTIDPISSTADHELSGSQPGEGFGYSVATAGDVNGDGFSDIIVGSPYWDLPFTDAGRAMIFLGSATGISSTPAWTVQGTGTNARFGFSVSSAGDVNGDGISDVVVGAPGHNGYGAAFVYTGSAPSGPGLVATAVWTGTMQAACEFGYSVALAGDVNGDGFSDVLVGAPLFDVPPSGTNQGRAYCYHGNTMTLGWNADGAASNAQFGFSLSGAGDLNGDGVSDVAIGAPYQPKAPTTNNGAVYCYQGNSLSGLAMVANTSRFGGGAANLGWSVSSAGDMNGDGYADLITGAPGAATGNGAAYVYLGTGVGTALIAVSGIAVTGLSGERLGQSVSLAGDVNGDGFADVIVGSPNYSGNKGKVQVFRGSSPLLLDAAHLLWSKVGLVAGDHSGAAVHTAGDVNGDGISDLLFAAPDRGGMGVVSIFYGSTDLLPSICQWSKLGMQAQGNLGRSVSSAGDVNGDGYSDMIIGGPGLAGGLGKAMLYMGSATGLSATPAWSGVGENTDDLYGHVVASAGDVNGDGYGDVIVGAPGFPNYTWRGKAYLYLGSSTGLSAIPAWTKTGENVGDRFAYGAAGAGDVNGDGFSDVILGAYMFGNDEGKAYVFNGSSIGLPAIANWTALGTPYSFYGSSVSTAGDVNGDGYDEVIVGANLHDVVVNDNRGGAFAYYGSPTGPSAIPSWSAFGAHSGSQFGVSVSYAGDVNGDGYSDVIVGEYYHTSGSLTHAGRAYVYQGSPSTGLSTSANTIIEGSQLEGQMGISVCSAGDVNGDGFGDVIVGAHLQSFMYLNQGMASIHLGSASGTFATAAWSVYGSNTGSNFGFSVALAGDVNGDGYSDVVIGTERQSTGFSNEGGTYVFLGNVARALPMPTYQYRGDLVTPVRTSNGTFDPDCAWGIGQFARSSMGRSKLKLVWQFIGHGNSIPSVTFPVNSTAYSGQGATWADSGLPGVLLKHSISTLGATSSHPAWRARVCHLPATALDGRLYGRWFQQGVHDLQVPSLKTDLTSCGPLPINLASSSVECVNGVALIEWATASEQDCANFNVQRSKDGQTWVTLGTVPCSGNSSSYIHYRFLDPAPLNNGVSYYRLVQSDLNGAMEVLPVLVLMPCSGGTSVSAWPNPFHDDISIHLDRPMSEGETITASFRDVTGRTVLEKAIQQPESATMIINGLNALPSGAYQVQVLSSVHGFIGHLRVIHL